MEIKYWIVCGIAALLGFIVKIGFQRILDKFDKVIETLSSLKEKMCVHDESIKSIKEEIHEIKQNCNNRHK